MLSFTVQRLENGYAVQTDHYAEFPGEGRLGRFFPDAVTLVTEVGLFVGQAVAAAEEAQAEHKRRYAEEQKRWAAQQSVSGQAPGALQRVAENPLPEGFRGVDNEAEKADARMYEA